VFFIQFVATFAAATSLIGVAAANETSANSASTPVETAAPTEAQANAAPPAEEAPVAEKVADNGDKVVCKYTARPGSRLGSKVCMTKDEWDQIRKDSKEGVDNMQRQNTAPGLPQG
jgi:hypothetical protein